MLQNFYSRSFVRRSIIFAAFIAQFSHKNILDKVKVFNKKNYYTCTEWSRCCEQWTQPHTQEKQKKEKKDEKSAGALKHVPVPTFNLLPAAAGKSC